MLFGEMVDGKTPQGGHVVLNDFGRIVCEEWERTAAVRPRVELGAYIVVPNHIHGILVFTDNLMNDVTVGATRRVAPTRPTLRSGSLGAVIGQFKSLVTKRINRLQNVAGRPIWQRNYGACTEPAEGNISSATNTKWTASPVTSNPTQPVGRRTRRIQAELNRRGEAPPRPYTLCVMRWPNQTLLASHPTFCLPGFCPPSSFAPRPIV